jgi:hypothetical protein
MATKCLPVVDLLPIPVGALEVLGDGKTDRGFLEVRIYFHINVVENDFFIVDSISRPLSNL